MAALAATRRAPRLLLALGLLTALAALARADSGSPQISEPREPEVLRIGAAASLRNVLEDLRPIFAEAHPDAKVEVAFGAPSRLAADVRGGAPLDLLLAADERVLEALTEEGLTETPVRFSGNRLVVIVSPDLDGTITSARQLLWPAVRRVAIPEDDVPVGAYARSWLEAQDLLAPLADRIVPAEDALARVVRGEAEAAIVYRSDARQTESARIAFEIPFLEQPRIAYAGAAVKGSAAIDLARAFLTTLREPRVSALFIRDGFTLAPGPMR